MSNKDSRKSGREKTVRAAKIDTYISDYFMSTLADKLIQRSRSNVFHLEGDGKMIEKIDAESLYEKRRSVLRWRRRAGRQGKGTPLV